MGSTKRPFGSKQIGRAVPLTSRAIGPWIALAVLLPASPSLAQSGAATPAEVLDALHAQDARVEAIGFRLATANAGLCPKRGWDPGISVHTLEQYGAGYRAAAGRLFKLHERVGVLSVAAGSPAAAAGLREGDQIVAANGAPLPVASGVSPAPDFRRTGLAQRLLAQAFAGGAASLSILRDDAPVELAIRAAPACRSIFQVAPDARMNGAADGEYVQVSSEMTDLAASPDELAGVLAHELAHNILGHRARLDALHVDRGIFASLGSNARAIRQTEVEADRLSIYLLVRGGYDPAKAIGFWVRLRRLPQTWGLDPTHPSGSARVRAMRQEYDRIRAAGVPVDDLPPPADLAREIPTH